MSNLTIFGMLIGAVGVILSFRIYRGPNWKRTNFLFLFMFSVFLIIVSVNPNVVNVLTEVLALKEVQRGRILSLLIISNLVLWLLMIYYRNSLDNTKQQFDLLVRKLCAEHRDTGFSNKIKPIMILVPAYQEEDNLRILLKQIPSVINGSGVGALVVDDGSTDNTSKVVKEMGFLVVRNIINRGQGAASRLGYDLLLNENVEILVTMDADNQHLPDEIEKIVAPIMENQYDLVIGSRVLGEHAKDDPIRSLGIRVFTKFINFVTGLKLTDCSSGFKAFNVKEMHRIHLKEEQFQAAEVLIEACKQGLRIGEVPITICARKYGKSKKGSNLSYSLNFLKAIIKTWWR